MERVRAFLKKNPIAGWAIVVGVVALAGYAMAGRLFGGSPRPAAVPTPQVVATPARPAPAPRTANAPEPAAPRAAATPAPKPAMPSPRVTAPTAVPSGPTGRPDPFVPLVRPGGLPPSGAPLPPPPFPVPPPPPGPGLPPPPLPGAGPGSPGSIPSAGIAITGIVGNSHAVAILNIGGRTEIVAEGETIGDLKVLNIDSARRVVQFLRAGKRFEVRMGGE